LRLLLASPEFHHWHHSNDQDARDRNFAGQLPFLDVLFGTLHMPRGRMPQCYGLDQPIPQRYAYQMLYPILGERSLTTTSGGATSREDSSEP
jgi:sterol desaturase/sphingolipid hydroxylase (fatty acid hydroxylase superfamily)